MNNDFRKLTERETQVWRYVVAYRLNHPCAPSTDDISRGTDLTVIQVKRAVNKLIAKGYVERDPSPRGRTMRVRVWPRELVREYKRGVA